MLVTPFAAFLLADAVDASGVLAVVSCGLFMSQVTPRITGAATRQIALPFWALSTTVLSSALFVLIGISAQSAFRGLTQHNAAARAGRHPRGDRRRDRGAVGLDLHHAVPDPARRPSPGAAARRVGARQRTVSAVAGFRGAVSLAAVLAVPHTLNSGAPFPDRDLIVLITCGVIVLTLLQALLLPAVVRFARLPVDTSVAEEVQLAEEFTLDAAIEAIDDTAAELGSGDEGRRAGPARAGQAAHAACGLRCGRRPCRPARRPVHEPRRSPSSAAGARHSSSCATSSGSTTSCCAGSRPGSTTRRCASPGPARWSTRPGGLLRGGYLTHPTGAMATAH